VQALANSLQTNRTFRHKNPIDFEAQFRVVIFRRRRHGPTASKGDQVISGTRPKGDRDLSPPYIVSAPLVLMGTFVGGLRHSGIAGIPSRGLWT